MLSVRHAGKRSFHGAPSEDSLLASLIATTMDSVGTSQKALDWWGKAWDLANMPGWKVNMGAANKMAALGLNTSGLDVVKAGSWGFASSAKMQKIIAPPSGKEIGKVSTSNFGKNVEAYAQEKQNNLAPLPEDSSGTSALLKYGLPVGIGVVFILGAVILLRK